MNNENECAYVPVRVNSRAYLIEEELPYTVGVGCSKQRVDNTNGRQERSGSPSGWTCYLLFCLFAITLGSTFIIGYNITLLNQPHHIFRKFVNQSYARRYSSTNEAFEVIWQFTVANFLIGGAIGALVGESECKYFGRKKAIILNSVIGTIAGAMMLSSPYTDMFELLLAGRFVAGIHAGSVSALVPPYLTELAPLSLRGAAGSFGQLSMVLGGLLASVLGLPIVLGRENEADVWPLLFIPAVFFPLMQIILVCFVTESPRWLVLTTGDENTALNSISKLRGKNYSSDLVDFEVYVLMREKERRDDELAMTVRELLQGLLSWPLAICLVMQLTQQLSGVNISLNYSNHIFGKVEFQEPLLNYLIVGINATGVIVALVSIYLVDKMGRRRLMLIGILGLQLACLFLCISLNLSRNDDVFRYLTVASTYIFIAAFSIGPGSIPWFIAVELSLPQFRIASIALCTFLNWSANIAMYLLFPLFSKMLGSYIFLIFMALNFIAFIFSMLFLPETKGLPVEENVRRLEEKRLQILKND